MSHQLSRAARRSFQALCLKAQTPVAAAALALFTAEDWGSLVSMKVDPKSYGTASSYLVDNQIVSFFKKYRDFKLPVDLERDARIAFSEAERQCFTTNRRLTPYLDDNSVFGSGIEEFLRAVKKEIKRVLGRCPDLKDLAGRFGPGSTFRDVGPYITVPDKMSSNVTMTQEATPLLEEFQSTAWHRYAMPARLEPDTTCVELFPEDTFPYAPRSFEKVRGNRFTTVPKTALKLRGICIEPSLNLFYQLAVGDVLTKRLGRVYGWSKVNAQQLHQLYAQLGSAFGNLATIDLASASDTVSEILVKILLPIEWYELLDMLRSKTTSVDGRVIHLEKFSSMGNGFTFELETLIFRAIAEVACRNTDYDPMFMGDIISTFGDDIVVPTACAQNVIAALVFCGFVVNDSKSFITGPFRESCGGDFFRGAPVRAHYLEESPDEPHQYIALANGINRFIVRHALCGGGDDFGTVRLRVLDELPSSIRSLRGPSELGDLVVHDAEDKWTYKVRSSIRYFRVWRPVRFGQTGFSHFRPGVVLASALFGVPDGTPTSLRVLTLDRRKPANGFDTRVNGSFVRGYRLGRVAYS